MGRWAIRLLVLMLFVATVMTVSAGGANYITPVSDYTSGKGKLLAQKYSGLLLRAVSAVTGAYSRSELRMVTLSESAVGGAGFWKNPAKSGTDSRYIGIVVMAKKPPYIFGQDRNGRVASVLDRYGKTMLTALTKQMQAVGPPGVNGVAIAVIWGDSVSGAPTSVGLEGMLLFLERADVISYKNYKLTIQNLVNRNDLFLFKGSGEIENLLQFILEA